MALKDILLPEFDQEMATTRRTLERVPMDKSGWKPHDKSFSLGHLASHVANIPSWAVFGLNQDSIDIAPVSGDKPKTPEATTTKELLDIFDKNMAEGRAAIAAASDELMGKPWSLKAGGQTLFTIPKAAVLRTWVMNHMIHHRAQLGVYLRLNNVGVPGVYGPSADEQM
ncbi:MAG: hypothetical protein JWO13_1974 [Acidobacteriales bacterium]|nr:hypothetical protein [Terriglobales bacterium]